MSSTLQGVVSVLGRLFLVTIFVMSAVGNKIPNYAGVASVMEGKGVPVPQVALALAIGFLVVGGVSVLVGYKARVGAALLAVFLVLATYYFHAFWALEGQAAQAEMIQFMKNLGLFGAMLFIIANGAGAWSLDACLGSPTAQTQSQRPRLAG
jgi:putative oxidoreductase